MTKRKKMSRKTRAALSGIMIAVGSIYALTVSYSIPRENLVNFLLGSLAIVAVAVVSAAILVLVWISLRSGLRVVMKLLSRNNSPKK